MSNNWQVRVLPVCQMALCLGTSIVYFVNGDIRKGCYWLFACCLTASVTF